MVLHLQTTMQEDHEKRLSPASSKVLVHFTIDFKSTNFSLDTNKTVNKYYSYMH